jgi:hypothetical protein
LRWWGDEKIAYGKSALRGDGRKVPENAIHGVGDTMEMSKRKISGGWKLSS